MKAPNWIRNSSLFNRDAAGPRRADEPLRRCRYTMGLMEMLEQSKEVALAARERAALQSAADIAEFEEYGADLAKAFDEEELAAAEEALRLGLQLDEEEEATISNLETQDLDIARKLLADEQALESAIERDERLARQLEAELQKEALQVAKLEKQQRQLAERKLCRNDLKIAEDLALEIEAQEQALMREERRDRALASKLVKHESKLLKSMPQMEEKLKTIAKEVNGDTVSMRARLTAKLGSMRKSLADMTNGVKVGHTVMSS